MQIGAMTNPYLELQPQIQWIGKNGFDYVDLAVEPPHAHISDLDPGQISKACRRFGLPVVVHTSPYLPVASRHPTVRRAAWDELAQAVALAQALDSTLVTIHFLGAPPYYSDRDIIDTYADLLDFLVSAALGTGVRVAMENSPANRNEARLFREIFHRVPQALLLLDVGHTHLNTGKDRMEEFLDDPLLGKRLVHVHASDNNGRGDLHLPPGSVKNSIHWEKTVRRIRRHPYDGRITLEVFSEDLSYLLFSRDKLAQWWAAAGR